MVNKHCCYGTCRSDSRHSDREHMRGVFFIPFVKPSKDLEKCRRWVRACSRERFTVEKVNKDSYICSLHFWGKQGPTEQHQDPIPANYSADQQHRFIRKRKAPTDRHNEGQCMATSEAVVHIGEDEGFSNESVLQEPHRKDSYVQATTSTTTSEVQTQVSSADIACQCDFDSTKTLIAFKTENVLLKHQLKSLQCAPSPLIRNQQSIFESREQIQHQSSVHLQPSFLSSEKLKWITSGDKSMFFYIGLTLHQFTILWTWLGPAARKLAYVERDAKQNEISPKKRTGRKRKLPPEEELLIALVRLRVGMLHQDIAYRFGIAVSSVSRIVNTWMQFLYLEFYAIKDYMFPKRDIIHEHLPKCFKHYKNIRCIIDCTEIFVEQSQDFGQQGNLYSHYKSHNTYKILIGISPNGAISFVSDCFEGSISDVEIVKQSGLLDLIDPGDMVMADRGFTIKDLLLEKQADLNIPPFLGDRDTFQAEEEARTKELAKLRIHVERAIERVKKFRLLQKVIPKSIAPVFSQMVFVASCLVNFQKPIVK